MDRHDNSGVNFEAESNDVKGLDIWANVTSGLKASVPGADYTKWISDLRFIAEDNGQMLVGAKDKYAFDRVDSEYRRLIETTWSKHDPRGRPVRLICWRDARSDLKGLVADPWAARAVKTEPKRKALSRTDQAKTFDNLVQGESNEIAVTMARHIAEGDERTASTSLIYGPQGVGKTHIMRAIEALAAQRNPDMSILYMTAEEFMTRYIDGAKARDTSGLKRDLRSADLVLIDDLQWISGKQGTDTEFFANIRAVTSAGGQVVMTADAAPGDLKGFSARLRSELQGGAAAEVGLPDDDMRRQIVSLHADMIAEHDENFQLTDEMKDRIVRRVRGPGRNLCGVLWSLHTATAFGRHVPTLAMLDKVIVRQEGALQVPTIDAVKRAAMRVFDVTKADLESPRKQHSIVYPRQIAMYLCRGLTSKSLPQIGRSFGKRDHTTVLYAVRKITKKIELDPDLAKDVERVIETLREMQMTGEA